MVDRPPGWPSPEEFERFFGAARVKFRCPMCDYDALDTPDDPALKGMLPTTRVPVGAPDQAASHLPHFFLICPRCGNIQMHSTVVVERWLAANPIAPGVS